MTSLCFPTATQDTCTDRPFEPLPECEYGFDGRETDLVLVPGERGSWRPGLLVPDDHAQVPGACSTPRCSQPHVPLGSHPVEVGSGLHT